MIVVKVELWSAINGNVQQLALMSIDNIGGTQQLGDYRTRTYRGRDAEALARALVRETVQREGKVLRHPRLREHVWNLVAKALSGMGYGVAAGSPAGGEGAHVLTAALESAETHKIGEGDYSYAKLADLPQMLREQVKDALFFECAPHVTVDAWNIVRMAADEFEARISAPAVAPPASDISSERPDATVEPPCVAALEAGLRLIDDMTRFVGQMSLRDYALLNDAPIAMRAAIAELRDKGQRPPSP